MKRLQFPVRLVVPFGVAACLSTGVVQAAPAQAGPALLTARSLNLAAALQAAQASLRACSDQGALVSVAVTDRSGNVLVVLRDPLAGMHTPDAATRKAWTAISFRNATSMLERATGPTSEANAIRQLPNVAMVAGGVPVVVAGEQVGAVGVSGAPNGAMDEGCARQGVKAITDELELGS